MLFREFDCEEHSQDALTLVTHDSPDTREVYPFNFEFRVRFTLDANTLHVSFITTNTGAKPLYYAPGAHEAYACPEGIEAYDVVFDKAEPLIRTVLDGNYFERKTEPVDADGVLAHKEGILTLQPGKTQTFTHHISILA